MIISLGRIGCRLNYGLKLSACVAGGCLSPLETPFSQGGICLVSLDFVMLPAQYFGCVAVVCAWVWVECVCVCNSAYNYNICLINRFHIFIAIFLYLSLSLCSTHWWLFSCPQWVFNTHCDTPPGATWTHQTRPAEYAGCNGKWKLCKHSGHGVKGNRARQGKRYSR